MQEELDRQVRGGCDPLSLRSSTRPRGGELEVFTTGPTRCSAQLHRRRRPTTRWPTLAAARSEARRLHRRMPRRHLARKAIERPRRRASTPACAPAPVRSRGRLPVYVANFVLMEYGTGAIFGCPAHDQRDLDFARKYGLPVLPVVVPPRATPIPNLRRSATRPIRRRRSDQFRFLDGMTVEAAKGRRSRALEARRGRAGERTRPVPPARLGRLAPALLGLPDPGDPLPACGVVPVPEADLPVCCPRTSTFDKPGNPLDRHPTWKHVACPKCGKPGAARDRHHGHLRRFVLVFRALLLAPRDDADRRAPPSNTGCRSTSISAASSTRSCTCSIRASSPAR
jgi:leucyl-tRNA synthetase